ncbi:MAG: Rieske 2Fe-2S domain-containing protein [Gemmatimonadota bacterium]|nr:Rieske 2Fe-2S domain-containing protein [Gemmatimonadota bacterium]
MSEGSDGLVREPKRDDNGPPGPPRRRRFLNWLLGTGAGALSASVLYPITRFLVPPELEESTTNQVTLPIRARDVAANSGQVFRFGSRPGMLIRTPAGELKAFDGMCTHLDCIVQYRDDISRIWCACHNGHYDLNGTNVQGPPPRPLEEYVVIEQDDQIIVTKDA